MTNWVFELVLTNRKMQVRLFFGCGFEILRFEKICRYNQFSCSPSTIQFANMQIFFWKNKILNVTTVKLFPKNKYFFFWDGFI